MTDPDTGSDSALPTINAQERGVRGFELDTELSFARTLTREEATGALRGWPHAPELYGQGGEIRGARLTGDMAEDLLHALLRSGLEGGLLKGAEVGRRGLLRSVTGATEWMPWRRNVVLKRTQLDEVQLEEGVRYVIE